jgi:hypothetical protein
MKKRWIWVLVLALIGVAAYAGSVLATPATAPGFSGTTLAKGTFGEIFSHVQTQDPQFWNEVIKTEGDSDLYVQQNTWDPSACGGCIPSTGWHTHPGPSLVIVTQGTVTEYDGDDPTCTPHVYSANGTNAFIDIGGGAVHIIRDESGAVAKTIAVQLIPAGATRRQDVTPAPGNCPF